MKLNDSHKKNIYKVPDGYFDELPQIIQTRIAEQNSKANHVWLSYGLKYALPIVLLIIVFTLSVINFNKPETPEELLAEVSTEELILYLEESDITTEELIETVDYESMDLEFDNETDIINDSDINDKEMEQLLNDYQDIDDLL